LNSYITLPFHFSQVLFLYLGSGLVADVTQDQLLTDQRMKELFRRLAHSRRCKKKNKNSKTTNMQEFGRTILLKWE